MSRLTKGYTQIFEGQTPPSEPRRSPSFTGRWARLGGIAAPWPHSAVADSPSPPRDGAGRLPGTRVAAVVGMFRRLPIPLLVLLLAPGVACEGSKGDADADAGPDAAISTVPRVDAAPASDAMSDVCTPAACAPIVGLPPLPEFPCGDCWADCTSEGMCTSLCVEASDCVFLSGGCGPQCESLCSDEHPCFPDQQCVDGICEPGPER